MIFKWCCKTYSESVSNVADEASAQLLSSFLEYEVLDVVNDRYDFEFLKLLIANAGQKTQLIYTKLKLLATETSQSFQSYLGNSNNKNNLVKSW